METSDELYTLDPSEEEELEKIRQELAERRAGRAQEELNASRQKKLQEGKAIGEQFAASLNEAVIRKHGKD